MCKEAAGTAEEGGALIRERRGCWVCCEWPYTQAAAHHLLYVLSQVCAKEVLCDGQLGGGGAAAPETQSHHWDVLPTVQEEIVKMKELTVCLVTEPSAWQKQHN